MLWSYDLQTQKDSMRDGVLKSRPRTLAPRRSGQLCDARTSSPRNHSDALACIFAISCITSAPRRPVCSPPGREDLRDRSFRPGMHSVDPSTHVHGKATTRKANLAGDN